MADWVIGAKLRWLALASIALFAIPLVLWLFLQRDPEPLRGLLVDGRALPPSRRALERELRDRADAWLDHTFEVRVVDADAAHAATRRELGASVQLEPLIESILKLGRSGNPLLDLRKWWEARTGQIDLRWKLGVDYDQLTALLERVQLRVEEPPTAGVSDGQGFSLPGRDGRALDLQSSAALISRALSANARHVSLPVQRVPAPAPLVIGSPDGALFEDLHEVLEQRRIVDVGLVNRPRPAAWLPALGDDCFSNPPQRPFCDGPRRVPKPHGPAYHLAETLGLGDLSTVGHLIHHPPKAAWVSAAGGPRPASAYDWPVPAGRLGRGFGYVRREELRDRIHAGVDIVAPSGSAIRAVSRGMVAYADNRVRGYGNLLVIIHESGDVSFNAHCQSVFVFPGERVEQGQVVAEVGMTGLALGPHLHFELRSQGLPIDPLPKLASLPARRD